MSLIYKPEKNRKNKQFVTETVKKVTLILERLFLQNQIHV